MDNQASDNEAKKASQTGTSIKRIFLNSRLRTLLLYVLIAVFLISLSYISVRVYSYYKEDKIYEEIRTSVQTQDKGQVFSPDLAGSPGPDGSNEQDMEPLPYTIVNGDPEEVDPSGVLKIYAELKAKNSDLVGWISIPGFAKAIDYPIMQSFDNEYYLRHDFYKNESNSGSIFMDFSNLSAEPDRNIIIYGHAMRNNSMFGNLRGYPTDSEKYEKVSVIYLDLLYTRLEYRVFSAYSCEKDFNYRRTVFTDDEDYMDFLNTVRSKSEHDFGIALSPRDKIITLSTCDKSIGQDWRIVIHGKLVKQVVYDDSGIGAENEESEISGDKKIVTSNVYLGEMQLQYAVPVAGDGVSPEGSGQQATSTESIPTSDIPTASDGKSPGDALMITESEWKDATFDPPFSSANALYDVRIPESVQYVRIAAKTCDPEARLEYTINDKKTDPERIELSAGENNLIVHVYSADGLYSRKYTIKVLR